MIIIYKTSGTTKQGWGPWRQAEEQGHDLRWWKDVFDDDGGDGGQGGGGDDYVGDDDREKKMLTTTMKVYSEEGFASFQ